MKIHHLILILLFLSCKRISEENTYNAADNFNQVDFLSTGIWKVIVDKNSLSDDVFFEFTQDSMLVVNNYKRFAKRLDYSKFDFGSNEINYKAVGEETKNVLKIIHQDTMLFWQKDMSNKKAKIYRLVYD